MAADGAPLAKQRFWLKAIAVWQMTGGAIGGVYFLDAIPRLNASADLRTVVLAVAISVCGLSLLSGWALLKQRRAARVPSLIIHAVQAVGFGTGVFTYRLVLGPYLFLYSLDGIGVEAGFKPQLLFRWGAPQPLGPHIIL